MGILTQSEPCTDIGRVLVLINGVLVLNDPAAR
jgi:hypothetical protein